MLLHHMFIHAAKKYEEKLAIIDRTLDRKVTYGKALIATLILSDKFKKYDPGFIGVMLPNSAGSVLTILGALMSGRTPVMINYSTGASQNCEFAQKKCDFQTIITSRALLDKINARKVDGMVFLEDIMKSIGLLDKIKAALTAKLPIDRLLQRVHNGPEDDNAVILFTSGSEKEPKAVQLTHANIWANLEGMSDIFQFYHEDLFLSTLPFFHVFGLTVHLWLPISYGMTFVTYANPLDFKVICSIVREEKCTFLVGTPIFLWGYLQKSERGDFETVRIALTGADKCPESLRQAFIEKHGITLLEGYGTTETSPVISVNTPDFNKPGSVGRTLKNVTVGVENYETGEACATGEIGKILVKGPNVMKGYFDDFEQTSLSIRHGYYDTGDMGYMDEDGYIWHVGRLRRFVKVGGEMVSLIRVEDTLERFLPKGVACCVVEVPDAVRGSRIVAAVTHQIDEKATLKQMAEHLPNIAMPKQFVVLDEFPRMGSGKIDFRKITDLVRDAAHLRK